MTAMGAVVRIGTALAPLIATPVLIKAIADGSAELRRGREGYRPGHPLGDLVHWVRRSRAGELAASYRSSPIAGAGRGLGHRRHDKTRQERLIAASRLSWVIVRPGALTDGAKRGGYRHGRNVGSFFATVRISRADVADFMLNQMTDNTYLKAAPGVCS